VSTGSPGNGAATGNGAAGRRRTGTRTVAVVGGGIAGLAAAWELSGGAAGPAADTPRVVLLEAGPTVGGKLRSEPFAGRSVDMGPDGFLGRRPEAADLCAEVGLGDDLVPIATSGAAVLARGRRRSLPAGLVLGIPTRFWPTVRSGILGPRGSLRLLRDVVAPRTDSRGPLGDRAIGPLVARKLGQRVVDALVDPLIGGIHAGGVGDMSSAAVFPLLLAVAQRRGSFMRALRSVVPAEHVGAPTATRPDVLEPAPDDGADGASAPAGHGDAEEPPAFWALRPGICALPERLAGRLTERGVAVRTGAPVELLDQADGGWVLHTPDGPVVADGLVLAVPAPVAAELIGPHDVDAATLLGGIVWASVAVVTFAFAADDLPSGLVGTGLLVPAGSRRHRREGHGDGHFLVTACTYLSAKWPHLSAGDEVLLRASVGRFGDERFAALDDDALVARVHDELGELLGLTATPHTSVVVRWPESFPQYRVHHLLRVTGIESALRRLPAVAVAGASYRGVGIPACVASGRTAAQTVMGSLSGQPTGAGPVP